MDSVISSARTTSATVVQPEGWPRPKGYANGMLAEGRVLVTGGVIGWNEHGVFAPDFAGQAAQVFANIRAILAAGGARAGASGAADLVRRRHGRIYGEPQSRSARAIARSLVAHYPAMAVVQVVRLVEPAARIEIEATAVLPTT